MPSKKTIRRARRDKAQGKSASTQAGEFVREEIHHVREGKHGARSAEQAIAIGLSKARRAGVDLPPREGGAPARRKSSRSAASHASLSRHAHRAASLRSSADRSAAAKKAARTKGPATRKAAARKAAQTRRSRSHA